jgi:uncharacterized repeat protein (TIGR02543 family)
MIKKSIALLIIAFILSSCNVQSSSMTSSTASSTNTSSASSSTISDVSSLTIATQSSLIQFAGLSSQVSVNAALTGGDESTRIDWFLNGVKSVSQNLSIFQFTPLALGKYEVYAQVGTVKSNVLNLELKQPSFNVTSVNSIDSKTIEIKGDSGYSFQVSNINVLDTSTYNIINNKYTLNLASAMTQGQTYNIQITKPGFESLNYSLLYETRKVSVGYLLYNGKKVTSNSQSVYEIFKPFGSEANQDYQISVALNNLEGTNVPVSIITTVPSGATAVNPIQTTANITRGVNYTQSFTLSPTTVAGVYLHNFTIGGVSTIVRVNVMVPTPTVELSTPFIYDDPTDNLNGTYTPISNPFGLDAEGENIKDVITPNANDQYIIYRPYNGPAKQIAFQIKASNFGIAPDYTNIYFMSAILTGPRGGSMLYGNTANTLTTSTSFTVTNTLSVVQYVDNKTDLGTYTYLFTVSGVGATRTKQVTVIVRSLDPKLTPTITYNTSGSNELIKANSDGSFTLYKPLGSVSLANLFSMKIENYESPKIAEASSSVGADTVYNDGTASRFLLNTIISYSGPLSSIPTLNTKIAVELGTSNAENTVDSTSPVVTYKRFRSATNTVTFNLSSLRDAGSYVSSSIFANFTTLNAATFPGVHTYTIKIGNLTSTFVLRVEEASPMLILKDDSVKYGATEGDINVSNVELNKTDGKYYVNGTGFLELLVYPFGMPNGSYSYSFSTRTPSGSFNSSTNQVLLTLKSSPYYDGTLNYPPTGPGSEMFISQDLDEVGEYVFDYNINNARKTVVIVVLPSPQLKVDKVVYNNEDIVEFNDVYYARHASFQRIFDLIISPVNIEESYKYVINSTGEFPTTTLEAQKKDIAVIDGKVTISVTIPTLSNPIGEDTHQFFIFLYKGTVRVGEITKVTIVSQPAKSTYFFNTNGGTNKAPVSGFVGAGFTATPNPTKTSFVFGGWFVDSALATAFAGTTFQDKDQILYAKWDNP